MTEEERKALRFKLDLISYRCSGALESLHDFGMIPKANAESVAAMIAEKRALMRKLAEG
jgi:hypothetical protein